jgi:polysaccharide biosynthesis transport protein
LSQPPGTDLAEHLSLLRRRRLLFFGLTLTGLVSGLGLWKHTPPAYTATTEVLVAPVGVQEQNNQVTNRQRESLNLDTEAQIAQSKVVARKAARSLRVPETEPAEVTVPPNSSVLWISVTAADPTTAGTHAQAHALAYLANRGESAQSALAAQQKALLGKLDQVNTELSEVAQQLIVLDRRSAEYTLAAHRQAVLNRQAYSLTMKYDALKTFTITPGSVISPAVAPTDPSSPSLPLHAGAGLMLGLLAGSGAAYARDRLDTRLRGAADVERLTGLGVLADLAGRLDRATLHELASCVVAACPGRSLLIRALPADAGTTALALPLAASAPISVLSGSDVGDLARADAALLVISLGRTHASDVASAARHLRRHDVPVIGVVTVTGALRPPQEFERSRALPRHTPRFDKLVVSSADSGAETSPFPAISDPPGKPK